MNVLEGLRAARVELFVSDGVGPHDVPLGGDVVLLQVHAQLDVVVLPLLVDVPKVDLQSNCEVNQCKAESLLEKFRSPFELV